MMVYKFLVLDGAISWRSIIITSLKSMGYRNIVTAVNKNDAFDKLFSEKFDFIIIDWDLKETVGAEFIEAIEKEPEFENTPILMITSYNSKNDVLLALEACINNYIAKPFNLKMFNKKNEVIY